MKFLRVREGGERQIIVDVAKSHKRPILYTLVVDVDEWKFHQCGNCVYNKKCFSECKVLEASFPIREFVKKKFEINPCKLSLVPIYKCVSERLSKKSRNATTKL